MNHSHYFIGLPIPEQLQDELELVQRQLNTGNYFKKVTYPKDFHITLLFLGGWDPEKIRELWLRLENQSLNMRETELKLKNISFFGKEDTPRVLWTGVEQNQELFQLHELVIKEAAGLGFSLEKRPFRPHITLGKTFISQEKFPKINIDLPPIRWKMNELSLFKVKPGKKPMYESVSTITFIE
ncbi:RNA 2',3'-cyclic phosphodiesterase [Evansella tamaricis]|uniref:RNA 2',3'-cyclic phosphodiesterase n=1 Tax=Evansella tamaricis TaxID=2069301 RepID=A0ABS6JJA1_9BACI|nr:RNA 2',3'-cyclic phosphodiesterase [Evansella tamaricis]MBU9713740.1 RNA 2',3'-cyclic phosphodiesterase [Evansella tamaricis]